MMRYIDSIPLKVLHLSQHKWIRTLQTERIDWTPCSICREIYSERNQPYERSHCLQDCFLTISAWCQNEAPHSRLHPNFSNANSRRTRMWREDVENFIWWMDLEIERIDEEELERMKIGW